MGRLLMLLPLRASWSRLDDVGLCRRLTLDGWDRLVEAEGQGRGLVVVTAGAGPWPLLVAALGLYRGPVDALVAAPRQVRRVPRAWLRRFAAATFPPAAALDPACRALEDRGRVLVVSDPVAGELARRTGAPRVSAAVRAETRGRYRILFDPTSAAVTST